MGFDAAGFLKALFRPYAESGDVSRPADVPGCIIGPGKVPPDRQSEARRAAVEAMRLSEFARAGRLVEVKSDVLGETVYFASDGKVAKRAPEGFAVYLPDEMRAALDLDPEELRGAHKVKKMFGGTLLGLDLGESGQYTTERNG